jgi:hypothetical protein
VSGKEVKSSLVASAIPSAYDLLWDASKVAPGVYYYELHIGANVKTGQIVIVK